jgi:hypothetical protein
MGDVWITTDRALTTLGVSTDGALVSRAGDFLGAGIGHDSAPTVAASFTRPAKLHDARSLAADWRWRRGDDVVDLDGLVVWTRAGIGCLREWVGTGITRDKRALFVEHPDGVHPHNEEAFPEPTTAAFIEREAIEIGRCVVSRNFLGGETPSPFCGSPHENDAGLSIEDVRAEDGNITRAACAHLGPAASA